MLSKTKLNKFFSDKVAYDPRNPGPMKPIVDAANNSYYRQRAIECIHSGDQDNLIMAIRLLMLVGTSYHAAEKADQP
jgi:hypothetical protein